MRVVLINAAAADGRAAGKSIIRSFAAFCGDVGGTGLGALDGDRISSFISGSVIVRFGFCAAADAGCTHTALCILDGDLSFNGHIAKAARAAADTGTFVAARCILDLCVAFDGHIAKAKSTAADACAAIAALRIFDRCVIFDGYSAGTLPTTAANTGRLFAASSLFNRCITGNCHIAFTGVTAADAGTSAAAGRIFNNSAASNGHSCITARTTAADACAANSTRLSPRVRSANGIDRSAGNGNVGITARTATADTGAIEAARRRGNAATGDLDFTGVFEISAANARTAMIAGSTQGTIAVGIGDGQFSAGFISLGISLFVVLQTGIPVAAGQCVVAVQLDVRIAAAGHIHSGLGCRAGVDLHIFQGDIGRLVFVCFDGDRVPRACAGDGNVGVLTILDVSVAVADVFFLFPIHKPLADEIAVFRSVDINGAAGNIIRSGKSRKGHAGHHGTGESESCDPLCGNAGRGRYLFLAERHRNMPQDAHGESAIRDH